MDISTLDLPDDVKIAFRYLFDTCSHIDTAGKSADKLPLAVCESSCFRQRLILHLCEESRDIELNDHFFDGVQLTQTDGVFKLILFAERVYEDYPLTVIYFDRAETETEVFRADRLIFSESLDGSPWGAVFRMANDIFEKSYWGTEFLSQKERELLPLLQELRAMACISSTDDGYAYDFPIMRGKLREHGLEKLLPLFDGIAAAHLSAKCSMRPFDRLSSRLNEAQCEALWRDVYGMLAKSQEGYPEKPGACAPDELEKIRSEITDRLHALGYEGEYPAFRKSGALKAVRLERSYGLSYFVGPEKNAEYMILCTEESSGGSFMIEFLCATAFPKKGECIPDAYACCFNAKGRRLFKIEFFSNDEFGKPLSLCIGIAAKKAECSKLSREERKLIYGNPSFNWYLFIPTLLIFGGLFAVGMTLGAIIVCCIVTLIVLGAAGVPDMMAQMPWLLIFLLSFFGAGVLMAIIEVKSFDKY